MDYIYVRGIDDCAAEIQAQILECYFPNAPIIYELEGKGVQLSKLVNLLKNGDRLIVYGLDKLARPEDTMFLLSDRRIAIVAVHPRMGVDVQALYIEAKPYRLDRDGGGEVREPLAAGKLTPAQWQMVDELAAKGIPQADIARQFGLSRATISRYFSGKLHARQRGKTG